ncbi:MAG TPA: alanine--tRNA ligase, partial [Planctomycetaceae bacterium]|nr:alanine--tRNA ligase [Planctomycetaceae bacterium]
GQATAASNDIAAGSDGDDYPTVKATLRTAARALNVAPFDVAERVQAMLADAESLSEQVSQVADSGELSADTLLEKAEQVAGAAVIIAETPGANPNIMRQIIDQIRQKVSPVAVLLAAPQGDSKVIVVAGLSRDLVENGASAGKWVGEVAKVMGGGGGGKPDMAQAGGKQPEKLADALQVALQTIQEQITA